MGRALGTYADKPNYAIQRNSGDTHWFWSPNALSTSTVGVRLAQKIGDNWEIIGVVEAGFNPYRSTDQWAPDRKPTTIPIRPPTEDRFRFRAGAGLGTMDKRSSGMSNPAYGTLTFGRTTLLSMSALSAYDPVASVAFSQLGFTALYATFGASPTSRINTAFTYRLTYQGFRVAAQAQVGGYDQDNAATEQYQAQIGTDFNGFSFDAIAGYAKNALTFQSFGGAPTPIGYNPDAIVRATAMNTGGIELLGRYEWEKFKFYAGDIYSLSVNPSNPYYPVWGVLYRAGDHCSPGLCDDQCLHSSASLNTVWTGLRYAVWSNLELACGRLLGIPERLPWLRPQSVPALGPRPAALDAPAAATPIHFLSITDPFLVWTSTPAFWCRTSMAASPAPSRTLRTLRRPSACACASDDAPSGVRRRCSPSCNHPDRGLAHRRHPLLSSHMA